MVVVVFMVTVSSRLRVMVILILIAMALLVLTQIVIFEFGTSCDLCQRENGAGAEVRVQEFPAIPPPLHQTIPPITSSDFTTGPNSNCYL